MKRYTLFLSLGLLAGCLMVLSCKNEIETFLDKAPGVDLDESVIFSSKVQCETFVAGTYRIGIHTIFPALSAADGGVTAARNFTINSAATDEAECDATFPHTQSWNAGLIDDIGTGQEDQRFALRWTALRNCNIILERIKDVPAVDDLYRNQVRGEMKFIIALNYFEMFNLSC